MRGTSDASPPVCVCLLLYCRRLRQLEFSWTTVRACTSRADVLWQTSLIIICSWWWKHSTSPQAPTASQHQCVMWGSFKHIIWNVPWNSKLNVGYLGFFTSTSGVFFFFPFGFIVVLVHSSNKSQISNCTLESVWTIVNLRHFTLPSRAHKQSWSLWQLEWPWQWTPPTRRWGRGPPPTQTATRSWALPAFPAATSCQPVSSVWVSVGLRERVSELPVSLCH